MAWKDAEAAAKIGGGKWIRLKDGDDAVTGVFVGEPSVKLRVYDGKNFLPFTKEHELAGESPDRQYSINFFELSSGRMRIMQGGVALFIALREVRENYGDDMTGLVFRVKRTGKKSDTRWPMHLMPNEKVPANLPKPFDLDEDEDHHQDAPNYEETVDDSPPDDLPF